MKNRTEKITIDYGKMYLNYILNTEYKDYLLDKLVELANDGHILTSIMSKEEIDNFDAEKKYRELTIEIYKIAGESYKRFKENEDL